MRFRANISAQLNQYHNSEKGADNPLTNLDEDDDPSTFKLRANTDVVEFGPPISNQWWLGYRSKIGSSLTKSTHLI